MNSRTLILFYHPLELIANRPSSKNTESLIRNLGKGDTADYAGCRECSICLGSVLVCLTHDPFEADKTKSLTANTTEALSMLVYGGLCPCLALQMHQSLDPHA